jgi:FO synthase
MSELLANARAAGGANSAEVALLRQRACEIRDQYWGRRITFSRKVFIPLTNMCRNTCGYCVFVKHPGDPKAGYLTPEEILDIARNGERLGCKEALFSLGERPELRYTQASDILSQHGYQTTIDYLIEACRLVLEKTSLIPHVNAGTLTVSEIAQLRAVSGSMGMMLENVSKRLMKPGLPHHGCPDKTPILRLRTIEEAGRQKVPFTTGILIGIGETWDERIDSLLAINEIHLRHGNVQEVIVQNFRAKSGTAMEWSSEPSREDMLRTLAVARLLLDPSISLQAPPNLDNTFEEYIDSGINDWGGVSPLTVDHINPERAWPTLAELERRTAAKGLQLSERLTVYPSHLNNCHTAVSQPLRRLAREDGLAREQFVR